MNDALIRSLGDELYAAPKDCAAYSYWASAWSTRARSTGSDAR
jgi:hypothetical protein